MKFVEIPLTIPDMCGWVAITSGYSFLINQDLGTDDPEFTGYVASWKSLRADMLPFGTQPANRIDGGPWPTFTAAERACRKTLKQLLRKN